MSITAIGGPGYASQLYAPQQAQAASAAGAIDPMTDDDPASPDDAATSLTGSTTASLNSQTLQALLDLTQQDPTAQSAGTGQVQHHRHHHHQGTGQAPSQTAAGDPAADTASAALTA